MPYVTSFERFAREEGREEGRRAGEAALVRLITRRFGSAPETLTRALESLPMTAFAELTDAILDLSSADELEAWVASKMKLPAE